MKFDAIIVYTFSNNVFFFLFLQVLKMFDLLKIIKNSLSIFFVLIISLLDCKFFKKI